jgi:hypothetical protein
VDIWWRRQQVPLKHWYVSTNYRTPYSRTQYSYLKTEAAGSSEILVSTNYTASHPRRQYILTAMHGIVPKHIHNHIFLSCPLNKSILNLLVSSVGAGIAQSVCVMEFVIVQLHDEASLSIPCSIKMEHTITGMKFPSRIPLLLTIQLRQRINQDVGDTVQCLSLKLITNQKHILQRTWPRWRALG